MTREQWARLNGDKPMPPGLRTPWVWIQPRNDAELLQRLAEARELSVHERERENLCGVAHVRISTLLAEKNT